MEYGHDLIGWLIELSHKLMSKIQLVVTKGRKMPPEREKPAT